MSPRFLSRACLALLLTAVCSLAVLAADRPVPPEWKSTECFDQWWRARADELRDQRGGPQALLPLRLLGELGPTAGDPRRIAETLEQIRQLPRTDPLVAAEIDARLIDQDLRRGDAGGARVRLSRLGAVTSYLVRGPLDDAEDAAALIEELGRGTAVEDWREVTTGPSGRLPLHELLHPVENRKALVAFWIETLSAGSYALRFGADDRADVWLDGERIAEGTGPHSLAFDQQAVRLDLSEGWHLVVFDVRQDSGWWSLFARVTRTDGSAVGAGLRVALPSPAPPLAKRGGDAPRERRRRKSRRHGDLVTLSGRLERLAGEEPRLLADVALDLATRELPDRDHARAVALAREAAFQHPRDPRTLWAAVLSESDKALERRGLERLLLAQSDEPGAIRRLAQYHLGFGQNGKALEYAQRGGERCGDDPFLAGWIAVARSVDGFPAAAISALEGILADHPLQPSLWERLGSLLVREGLPVSAIRAYGNYLPSNQTDRGARWELLRLYRQAGRLEQAHRLLRQAIELEPLHLPWRSRLAEMLLGEKRPADAAAALAPARELAPDDPQLLELAGEISLSEGDVEQTARLWQQVIDVSGESSGLAERLANLTGSGESFGGEWTVGLDEARAISAAATLENDPPLVVLSRTDAFRIKPNGMSSRFRQVISEVRDPEGGAFARSYAITYSPRLQQATILDARLVRADGSVILAGRNERPLVRDPQLRMWYDSRVIELSFPRLMKGDLIEVRYRLTDSGSANPIADRYFGEVVIPGNTMPVLSARVVIESPESLPIEQRLVHMPAEAEIRRSRREDHLLTEILLPPLPAYPSAPMAPPVTNRVPYVVIGSVRDWQELGQMYARLLRPQMQASGELRRAVQEATLGARNRREKIEAIYAWVISNTRYVALELGIHAIKPYSVGSVLERHYGDCKDKATLMVAMLEQVGVPARVALLRSRDRGTFEVGVPVFSAFDHAIVYLPEDGLWFDGTVLNYGPLELPAPDRGALALVIDPAGEGSGELVTTPEPRPEDAVLERRDELSIETDGDVSYKTRVDASGENAAIERHYFRLAERQVSILESRLREENVDLVVDDASFDELDLAARQVRYRYRGSVRHHGRVDGDRISVLPWLVRPPLPGQAPPAGRDVPIWLPPPFRWLNEVDVKLPRGTRVIEAPRPAQIDSPWGAVRLDSRERSGSLRLTLEVEFTGGEVSVDEIGRFSSFVQATTRLLTAPLVLEIER